MYGGQDRASDPALAQADQRLIRATTAEFGSRRAASAAFVDHGFALYFEGEVSEAMQRFNQAWLIDADNPDVYWGFASIEHAEEKPCEAKRMIDMGLERGLADPDALADAGRLYTLCTVASAGLGVEEREQAFHASDRLFFRALGLRADSGYLYASWAKAYYWRGDFANAWAMVRKSELYGARPAEPFMAQLRAAQPEPLGASSGF